MIKKQHPIFGTIVFNVDVTHEHDCRLCIHSHVCSRDFGKFCNNHRFVGVGHGTVVGSMPYSACIGCAHRYTHFSNEIPCFQCKHYEENKATVESVFNVKQEFPDMKTDEFMSWYFSVRSNNPKLSDEEIIKEIKRETII